MPADPRSRPCRACGRAIIFAQSPGGRALPLERMPHTYRLEDRDGQVVAVKVEEAYLSHFIVCEGRDEF